MAMSEQHTFRLEFPASLQYLNVLGACLSAIFIHVPHLQESNTAYNVELAVHEICVNIVLHAYASRPDQAKIDVLITFSPEKNCLTVTLYDDGEPFDKTRAKKPSLEHEQLHGYGLFLAENLMDHVDYQRVEGRNRWNLKKCLSRP